MYSYPYPNNSCSGMNSTNKNYNMFNIKQYKQPASSFTSQRKVLTVTSELAEKQTETNNICTGLNPAITNTGGPGDKITHNGLDKKHNHYDRYLSRKKGWILRNQHCNSHNNVIFSIPPIAPPTIPPPAAVVPDDNNDDAGNDDAGNDDAGNDDAGNDDDDDYDDY